MDGNDFRNLYTIMPDQGTVTYAAQVSLGSYSTSVAVSSAWWRASAGGTLEMAPSDGVYLAAHRDWYFPKTSYASIPAPGDLIVNSVTAIDPVSLTWTVLGVDHAGALGAWKLSSISLQLSGNLRGTLTFSRPDTSQDASGRPRPNYTAYASNVPARVQPQGGNSGEVFERVTTTNEFTAYIGTQLFVRAHDRVTDGTNNYTVKADSKPARLAELQEVSLVLLS